MKNGLDSIRGLAKEDIDNDNPFREVFDENSKFSSLLNSYDKSGDGKINAEEIKNVKSLVIDENMALSSLDDLVKFPSLQELTLKNFHLDNLRGIENNSYLSYICLTNFTTDEYSNINFLESSLEYLYLVDTSDNEVKKLCDSTNGIANGDFSKLHYFAVSGCSDYINNVGNGTGETSNMNIVIRNEKLTDISPLSNLSSITKKAINYLSLNNNNITSISSLTDFENVVLLKVEMNKLVSLKGVGKMNNLTYLFASYNNLGGKISESEQNLENIENKNSSTDSLAELDNKTQLKYVYLNNNSNLIWVDYLSECINITSFYLRVCSNLSGSSLALVKDIFNKCALDSRSIDEKFLKFLTGDDIFIYSELTPEDTTEIDYLISLPQNDKNKVKKFDLSNSTLDNTTLNNILEGYTSVECLNVNGCSRTYFF